MRRLSWLLLFVCFVAGSAVADEPTPKGVEVREASLPDPGLPSIDDLGPSVPSQIMAVDLLADAPVEDHVRLREITRAMHEELQALSLRTASTLEQIATRREKAAPDAIASLDATVERLKRDEILESLRIQARFAREAGAEAVAAQIDAALANMLEPSIDRESVDRTPRPRPARN